MYRYRLYKRCSASAAYAWAGVHVCECVLVYLENPLKGLEIVIKSTAFAAEFQSSRLSCPGSWPSLPVIDGNAYQ